MVKGVKIVNFDNTNAVVSKEKPPCQLHLSEVIMTSINKNLPHTADPEQRKQTEALHLLGLGNPEDIANACIYPVCGVCYCVVNRSSNNGWGKLQYMKKPANFKKQRVFENLVTYKECRGLTKHYGDKDTYYFDIR